ncbi:hypothetical protein, partial [Yersinia mollaretii]|uniref:hypothetical protein n=2 Tax=Yersinia mollaretii TaxID=33060 RepID=UPI001E29F8D2
MNLYASNVIKNLVFLFFKGRGVMIGSVVGYRIRFRLIVVQRLRSKEKGKIKTVVLALKLTAYLSCRVKREGKENGQDAR